MSVHLNFNAEPRLAPGQGPPHRRGLAGRRRQSLSRSHLEPIRRDLHSAARAQRRGLGVWAAESVAVLVRCAESDVPILRRRRAVQSGGGGSLPTLALAVSAWTSVAIKTSLQRSMSVSKVSVTAVGLNVFNGKLLPILIVQLN